MSEVELQENDGTKVANALARNNIGTVGKVNPTRRVAEFLSTGLPKFLFVHQCQSPATGRLVGATWLESNATLKTQGAVIL